MILGTLHGAFGALVKSETNKNIESWIGHWGNDNTSITIYKVNSLLAISGSDSVSTFQMRCLPDSNWETAKIEFVGSGHQFLTDLPDGIDFTIISKFSMHSKSELSEHWIIRS